MPKKWIDDPKKPGGGYMGYTNAEEAWVDFQNEQDHKKSDVVWSKIGYSTLAVFFSVVVILTVLAGEFKW